MRYQLCQKFILSLFALIIISVIASDGAMAQSPGDPCDIPSELGYYRVVSGEAAGDINVYLMVCDPFGWKGFLTLRRTANNGAPGGLGIGQSPSSGVELDVLGDIEYTGTLTDMSDRRLKTDIAYLSNGQLEKLLLLQAVSFKMKDDIENKTEFGFIAQDVQSVYPNLVFERSDKMLSMNYVGLIGPMVAAIKEQNTLINALKEQNDKLISRIEALEEKTAH